MKKFRSNKPATLTALIAEHWKAIDKKQAECVHGNYRFIKYNSGGGKLVCKKCNKVVDACLSPAAWPEFRKKHNLEIEF